LAKDAFEGIAASGVRQAYLQRGYSVEEVEVEVNVSTSQSRLVRNVCFAEGVSKTKQADGEIHEDQL